MARLLGIHIKNFRSLKDVQIGKLRWADPEPDLPPLSCFIGANGCGKSSLMDAFGFLADCLREGVEAACDKEHRGGFVKLRTQGTREPIAFKLHYRRSAGDRPVQYELHIDEKKGVPLVTREVLLQSRPGAERGRLFPFLDLSEGHGVAYAGEGTKGQRGAKREPVTLDARRLGITMSANIKEHPRIVAFREYIEKLDLSYFVPNAARRQPPAGAQRWLDREGGNVANVLQYFERQHPQQFKAILARVATSIPGIKDIKTEKSLDGRLLIKFDEQGYKDPFFQQSMSDGTLKMLAYAILLNDPEPRPFLGIEEPENGLYVQLVESLARQLRKAAEVTGSDLQVLVTTHSPYFVDALLPEQVWLMKKGDDGLTSVQRVADLPRIKQMFEESIPLGALWYSNEFEERRIG